MKDDTYRCTGSPTSLGTTVMNAVAQLYPWFKLPFLFFLTHYHDYHTLPYPKTRKIKIGPKITLNHNINIWVPYHVSADITWLHTTAFQEVKSAWNKTVLWVGRGKMYVLQFYLVTMETFVVQGSRCSPPSHMVYTTLENAIRWNIHCKPLITRSDLLQWSLFATLCICMGFWNLRY